MFPGHDQRRCGTFDGQEHAQAADRRPPTADRAIVVSGHGSRAARRLGDLEHLVNLGDLGDPAPDTGDPGVVALPSVAVCSH
ncbi:hypothetical protein [Streptomyces poonensis]|uniref:hypothetical protein n=1 Tax=Streptomyces poonensis TaxID=68255 RepID=UPI00167B0AB1|nr:hypothetical protein [Streptomyces poonensis]